MAQEAFWRGEYVGRIGNHLHGGPAGGAPAVWVAGGCSCERGRRRWCGSAWELHAKMSLETAAMIYFLCLIAAIVGVLYWLIGQ